MREGQQQASATQTMPPEVERIADSHDEAERRRQHHVLKSHKRSFAPVLAGTKRHEVRRADRPFTEGDRLTLVEVDEDRNLEPTGRRWEGTIGHVTAPGDWALPEGLCAFTLMERW